ncbi:MAG: putative S-layer protein [DPANN group archaeon]|nr:putative S-layer protein [DPANN group archaeon]
MTNNIARLFTIFVTALFLATPVVAELPGSSTPIFTFDNRLTIGADIETTNPTLGNDLDFTILIENVYTENFEDVEITTWIADDNEKKVGEKIETSLEKINDGNDEELNYIWQIPGDISEGKYTLNVEVDGKWDNTNEKRTYDFSKEISFERADHTLMIDEVEILRDNVKAGSTIDASVTVLNAGTEDENNVIIELNINKLDLSVQSKLTSTLLDSRDSTQYLTLEIPENTKSGTYDLQIRVYNGYAQDVMTKQITIEGSDELMEQETSVKIADEMTPGKASVVSIKITNDDNERKVMTFEISGMDWGSARVDPSQITLDAGESVTVAMHIVPDKDSSGKQTFNLIVKEDGKTVIQNQKFEANVGGLSASSTATNLVIVMILALAVFLFWKNYRKQ